MKTRYFKARRRFDFSPHPYELGTLTGLWNWYEDNHFLWNAQTLSKDQYATFYNFHLDDFLKEEKGTDKDFFGYVWYIVQKRIDYFEKENPFSKKHADNERNTYQLNMFRDYLVSIDQWNTGKTKDMIITEQRIEILELKIKLSDQKQELSEARKLETDDYIIIRDGQLLAVVDLCLQMQDLKATDGKELFITNAQIAWAKMICKYFRESDLKNKGETKEIKIDRVRHYLRGVDPKKPEIRATPIPAKHQLYTINPAKKRS